MGLSKNNRSRDLHLTSIVSWRLAFGPHARYTLQTVYKRYYGKVLKCMKKTIFEKN